MPIIVGGTNYYIESLLWNTLIKSEVSLRTHKHVYVFLSYKHDRLGWTWLYGVLLVSYPVGTVSFCSCKQDRGGNHISMKS